MSHLRLVKSCKESFRGSTHDIVIDLESDPRWAKMIGLFPKGYEIDEYNYRQWWDAHQKDAKDRVRILLGNDDGPDDYTLEANGTKLYLHFNNMEDSQKAAACLFPDETFDFVYLNYPQDVPKDYLEGMAKNLQSQYDAAIAKKASQYFAPVRLRADFENNAIRAQAKGADLIRVLSHAKNFATIINNPEPSPDRS